MVKHYHRLAKKAIFSAVGTCLVLVNPAFAKIPNDPSYQSNIWGQINASQAWDYGTGSAQVTVAVIDTGVDTWHPDLRDNIWVNPGEISDNGIDDDHNGYVDDVNGWNFVENNNDVRTSVFEKSDNPEAIRHGTLVAGLIGAVGNNNLNGAGLNWRVKIMPVRAIGSDGSGFFGNVTRAVDYAVNNGANVITMSFIGDEDDAGLKQSLKRAYERGIVVVGAAGNDRYVGEGYLNDFPKFPICYDQSDSSNWIIGVTSVNQQNLLSSFADYGNCVDIVAPGENIASTERYAPQFGYDLQFGNGWRGTSFSAPIVAGAAALLKSLRPDWGAKEIIADLLDTADNIDSLNPNFSGKIGRGLLNIGRAAAAAMQNKPVTALSSPISSNFYYWQGKEILRQDLIGDNKVFLAKLNDAEIKDIANGDINNDGQEEVALLIKRGKFNYVRILNNAGELIREFYVLSSNVKTQIRERIRILPATTADGGAIVFEISNLKTGESKFYYYDILGNQLKTLTLKVNAQAWDVGNTGSYINIARFDSKKKLVVEQYDWQGNKILAWQGGKVDEIDDIRAGNFWGGGEQTAILSWSGKSLRQIVVDLPSQSSLKTDIGDYKNKLNWRLRLESSFDGLTYLLNPYNLYGGEFTVFSGKGQVVKTVHFPVVAK